MLHGIATKPFPFGNPKVRHFLQTALKLQENITKKLFLRQMGREQYVLWR